MPWPQVGHLITRVPLRYSLRPSSASCAPAARWCSAQVTLRCQGTPHAPHHTCLQALHTSAGLSPSARHHAESARNLSGCPRAALRLRLVTRYCHQDRSDLKECAGSKALEGFDLGNPLPGSASLTLASDGHALAAGLRAGHQVRAGVGGRLEAALQVLLLLRHRQQQRDVRVQEAAPGAGPVGDPIPLPSLLQSAAPCSLGCARVLECWRYLDAVLQR